TETVYGLGADASKRKAVKRIFEAKGRPATHPLIVHLKGSGDLERWAREIPDAARQLAERFWPGPLTLVLKRAPKVLDVVTGGQDTVGLRVPSHPVAQALLQAFGGGIAAPSANRFGRVSATTAQHVREELGERVDLILDGGACPVGIESTILDLSTGAPVLLRPGHITAEEIGALLHAPVTRGGAASPRAPGGLAAHYAPQLPLRLVPRPMLDATVREQAAHGPVAVLARHSRPTSSAATVWMHAPLDAASYAQHLYAGLRQLDRSGCVAILVEAPPETADWAAVRDRLTRAARGSGAADRIPVSSDASDGT
ncbi:MAG TPA: L-threonylcarbamoyladenylate synthase, partial [Burkholderiales bacterium]|nr:L-threonylcarbamoyladenylate synthase [Burkholderiales bacterium]